MKPCNINSLLHKELISKATGENYSSSAVLTDHLGFKDIFVHHEILLPGIKTSAPHIHTHREEMILVLSGCPTAHVGEQTFALNPGDFIGFKPNLSAPHFFENSTKETVSLLIICSNPSNDKII